MFYDTLVIIEVGVGIYISKTDRIPSFVIGRGLHLIPILSNISCHHVPPKRSTSPLSPACFSLLKLTHRFFNVKANIRRCMIATVGSTGQNCGLILRYPKNDRKMMDEHAIRKSKNWISQILRSLVVNSNKIPEKIRIFQFFDDISRTVRARAKTRSKNALTGEIHALRTVFARKI